MVTINEGIEASEETVNLCRESDTQDARIVELLMGYYKYSSNAGEDVVNALENYCGEYNSPIEFTEQLMEDIGTLDRIPDDLVLYFDTELYCRDLFIADYFYIEDKETYTIHVFHTF